MLMRRKTSSAQTGTSIRIGDIYDSTVHITGGSDYSRNQAVGWIGKVNSWFAKPRHLVLLASTSLILVVALMTSMPLLVHYYNNRGVQLQRLGHIDEAIASYQWALRLNSNYADAHYNLAEAYEEIPNYDKALLEYRRAIDNDLTFYEAYNNLARLYILHLQDYAQAMRLLDRAIDLDPKEVSVQYSLRKNYAWANFGLHQYTQAEQNLRVAISLDSHRGAAHCLLAKTLDAEERSTALAEWESCISYSSQLEVEPEWRNEAQERLGRN